MLPNLNHLNHKINKIKLLVKSDLNKTIKELIKQLEQSIVYYNKDYNYIIKNNGKKLRPLLLLLAAKSIHNQKTAVYKKNYIRLATAIELIHNASLLHDDVLDNCLERHGRKTINAEFNDKLAILLGDLLYSKSFDIVNKLQCQSLTKIIDNIACTSNLMVKGEILQLSQKYNFSISKKKYLSIVIAKTAKLFMSTMQLPAILSCDKPNEDFLANCGLNFGIAYQLLDDIKDYYKKGNDIIEGKITLPILFVLKNRKLSSKIKQSIIKLIKNQAKHSGKEQIQTKELRLLSDLILHYGGFIKTAKLAKKYLSKAKKAIDFLPDSKYKNGILNILNSYDNYASSFTL